MVSCGYLRYPFRMHTFSSRLINLGLLGTLLLGLVLTPESGRAQAGGAEGGDEVSIYLGSMLPNQIEGVTEILPVFGGRYGMSTASVGVFEVGLSNSHAEGVDFTTLSGSLRADLPSIDQFVGTVYGGIDVNYYRPVNSTERRTETGLHVGTGLLVHISDTLWLRSDLKFSVSPGTSLSILFGFVFRSF